MSGPTVLSVLERIRAHPLLTKERVPTKALLGFLNAYIPGLADMYREKVPDGDPLAEAEAEITYDRVVAAHHDRYTAALRVDYTNALVDLTAAFPSPSYRALLRADVVYGAQDPVRSLRIVDAHARGYAQASRPTAYLANQSDVSSSVWLVPCGDLAPWRGCTAIRLYASTTPGELTSTAGSVTGLPAVAAVPLVAYGTLRGVEFLNKLPEFRAAPLDASDEREALARAESDFAAYCERQFRPTITRTRQVW